MTLKEIAIIGVVILAVGLYLIARLLAALVDNVGVVWERLDDILEAIEVLHNWPDDDDDTKWDKPLRMQAYYREKEHRRKYKVGREE
jgi:hypothetical protein